MLLASAVTNSSATAVAVAIAGAGGAARLVGAGRWPGVEAGARFGAGGAGEASCLPSSCKAAAGGAAASW